MTTVETTTWEQNVARHDDPRLVGPRDPAWWYTGRRPADCPGVDADGVMTSMPLPDLSTCSRRDVLDYFDNTWTLQETLFAGLQGVEAFYRPPSHNLRHPLAFYYGHPAALYVNKLRVAGLLTESVDAYLEDILETGVDEMSWDDLDKNEMPWPAIADIHAYRATVYRLVRGVVEDTDFAAELGRPVAQGDRAWAVFLSFEHDRIHLETSSVLIRELPIECVAAPDGWPAPAPQRRTTASGRPETGSVPENPVLPVTGGVAQLGKPVDFPSFGWDNEYGGRNVEVPDFGMSRTLVSNGEFHAFITDDGYFRPELWTEEGERWRRFRNTKFPRWWVQTGPAGLHAYRLRTTFDEIDMPWDWPVCVNQHEARAFLAWRSERDGRTYRLPSEAEHRLAREVPATVTPADDPVMSLDGAALRERGINLNLAFGSESPVDLSPRSAAGLHDVTGNVWAWCEDVCNPLEGFEVHPYYDDFTVPCFDNAHFMILGGAFVSTGDEASVFARYHFRPHFLQQSGIRLVDSPADTAHRDADRPAPEVPAAPAVAAGPADLSDEGSDEGSDVGTDVDDVRLLFAFGTARETFERTDHRLDGLHGLPTRLADLLLAEAARIGVAPRRVLDLGCGAGGTAFALAAHPGTEVVGVESDAGRVGVAERLAGGEAVAYERPDRGEIRTRLFARAPERGEGSSVTFRRGEPCELPDLGRFDAVVLGNALDDLGDPERCLRQFTDADRLLARGGLLLVASPWSEYMTKLLLASRFDLVAERDEAGVLRDDARHFAFVDADVTLWRKR